MHVNADSSILGICFTPFSLGEHNTFTYKVYFDMYICDLCISVLHGEFYIGLHIGSWTLTLALALQAQANMKILSPISGPM